MAVSAASKLDRPPRKLDLNEALADQQAAQLDAVIIRNLTYELGRGKSRRRILNKINLTVPEGAIYGLLGPSGCGKTTMLRSVVGRVKPSDGSVIVFGFRPGDARAQVPGRDIGYMPQEISIYEDFTIEETLRYFGKINRMDDDEIAARLEFLLQFLDLPSRRRLVVNLSGGQKRRVSLAAALVHSPPLLILDEPTVGVDPLLRQNIWEHLVTLTQTERISVIITTHYIEEARLANVVGLMRHGKILAEDSPSNLMRKYALSNLEEVFLKLCMDDSHDDNQVSVSTTSGRSDKRLGNLRDYQHSWSTLAGNIGSGKPPKRLDLFEGPSTSQTTTELELRPESGVGGQRRPTSYRHKTEISFSRGAPIVINTGTGQIQVNRPTVVEAGYTNEAVEFLSSEEDTEEEESASVDSENQKAASSSVNHLKETNFRQLIKSAGSNSSGAPHGDAAGSRPINDLEVNDYLALQVMRWAARRNNELNLMSLKLNRGYGTSKRTVAHRYEVKQSQSSAVQWWDILMAVTWKNYIRLRRNPPVLIFQFMLPAIQVILFCLCIGGEPFDVPVAIVNDELDPRSSLQFLNGLNTKIIRQIKYDNLSSAMEAVRRGTVWGALHIPDKYSENLQTRLIMGEEANNETITNGTIRVYPDLTNLHLSLALENSFRETFINFARDSLEDLGYDRSLADMPIQIGKPVYGTMRKDGYLEFMAPGVVISISYVMATGLTALAFILERRDGLLERSLVSGVHTTQILLAHAINQIFVMTIQIFLVLGCTFFVFEIPSRGPFFWVVLLILLQGCTGMGFGLLVSAICKEENTAVMMVVGTFYTNLILAGIIWPIEAMPHWLRPLSYAQPQTLPTETLRHILSRGWGITEFGVLLGFAVTIGWLSIFLMTAGVIFKYSR